MPLEELASRTGKMPVPPLGEEQILEAIASGDQTAADIARRVGVSILELAAHVCTPRNIEALERVAKLHAIEREMLLGKLKRDALVRLAELTDEVPAGSADEIRAFEVMRRACRDLLRYGGVNTEKHPSRPGVPGGPGVPGSGGHRQESISPAFETEVLEALERLGEETNQYEPQASPPVGGTDSDRRESSVGVASTASKHTDNFGRKAALRCQWHQTTPPEMPPETPPETSPAELVTRTDAPGMLGMPGSPAPPNDGSIGQRQSRHCPGCPAGGHEEHAGPGTKHGTVSLDDAHPP